MFDQKHHQFFNRHNFCIINVFDFLTDKKSSNFFVPKNRVWVELKLLNAQYKNYSLHSDKQPTTQNTHSQTTQNTHPETTYDSNQSLACLSTLVGI